MSEESTPVKNKGGRPKGSKTQFRGGMPVEEYNKIHGIVPVIRNKKKHAAELAANEIKENTILNKEVQDSIDTVEQQDTVTPTPVPSIVYVVYPTIKGNRPAADALKEYQTAASNANAVISERINKVLKEVIDTAFVQDNDTVVKKIFIDEIDINDKTNNFNIIVLNETQKHFTTGVALMLKLHGIGYRLLK